MANMLQASRAIPMHFLDEANADGGKASIRRRARRAEKNLWIREAREDMADMGIHLYR